MTNENRSVLLTYVTHHDTMANEHWRLFSSLQAILKDAIPDNLMDRQIARLNDFLAVLEQHHETEGAMLQVVSPSNREAHLADHLLLSSSATEILSNCEKGLEKAIREQVRSLQKALQIHVSTLDRELAALVDSNGAA
jgi:hemerythrin